MKSLELSTFPLDALSLIEASAGTGKTYALANLYLRYLLEKQYSVEQILVVTFTDAATQELRDRIRARIVELGECFDRMIGADGQEVAAVSDTVLAQLLQNSTAPEADRLRLKIAERQMDQAEIHTIHGFCQRMLRDYALESQVALEQNLVEDLQPLLMQLVEDFWRREVLNLPSAVFAYIYQHWRTPEALLNAVLPILKRSPERLLPALKVGGLAVWQQQLEQAQSWFQTLKAETRLQISEVRESVSNSQLKSLNTKLGWLDIIAEWSQEDSVTLTFPQKGNKKNLLQEFTRSAVIEACKKGQQPPEHGYFEYLEQRLPSAPEGLQEQFQVQVYGLIQQQFSVLKQQQQAMGFDDLISLLAQSLTLHNDPQRDAYVLRFLNIVRGRFGCALIDEFQDTDKAQYHIFSTLFGPAAKDDACRLVLIGDPKQAIYSFRGGDIATYLKAKAEISAHPKGQIFTMDTNWRSSPAMVAAVNCVFSQIENPFKASQIPFVPVNAAKAQPDQPWGAALRIAQVAATSAEGRKLSKEQINAALTQACVEEIQCLLAGSPTEVAVASADIAILVRSAREAEMIKQALADVGIRASYHARQSIFDSAEAEAILGLLQAVAKPDSETALKRCLAQLLFAFDDASFQRLLDSPAFLEQQLSHLQTLHDMWQRKGVLAMVRQALQLFEVLRHWGDQGPQQRQTVAIDWERSLSNLNQLAELLQQQSRRMRGQQALIRWLQLQIESSQQSDNDENRLRLESDEQLVRIVTIHKSKGLEYPLVFLPYFYGAKAADQAWFYDDDGRLCYDLMRQASHMSLAEQERLAEDMRLLYVALTRAKYHCYLGTAAYTGHGNALGLAASAWGQLALSQAGDGQVLNDDSLSQHLTALSQLAPELIAYGENSYRDHPAVSISTSENPPLSPENGDLEGRKAEFLPEKTALRYGAKRLITTLDVHWKVQSFTGLMHEHERQAHGLTNENFSQIAAPFDGPNTAQDQPPSLDILSFPRGSRAGTFLHQLFEALDFENQDLTAALQLRHDSIEQFICRTLRASRLVSSQLVEAWSQYLSRWLTKVLEHPMLADFSLSSLASSAYVVEMSFHYPVEALDATGFNQLLKRNAAVGEALEFSRFEGQLKGAIDLVFRHQDQYFVLDYKSNYLGSSLSDYLPAQLERAIFEHRYDVQYLLYSVALHRHLRQRLGSDYDFQRDFGGVLYVFLRGLDLSSGVSLHDSQSLASARSGVYFVKPDVAVIEALDQLMRGREGAAENTGDGKEDIKGENKEKAEQGGQQDERD